MSVKFPELDIPGVPIPERKEKPSKSAAAKAWETRRKKVREQTRPLVMEASMSASEYQTLVLACSMIPIGKVAVGEAMSYEKLASEALSRERKRKK